MFKRSEFKNKKVLIIGLGKSGKAAAHFLLSKGAKICGVDKKALELKKKQDFLNLIAQGIVIKDENQIISITDFDCVILSPGIPQNHSLVVAARSRDIPVIGEIELGCQWMDHTTIGITGTNGKTTVTLLLEHIFKNACFEAYALGNSGIPLTQEIEMISKEALLCLELSSYQLETLQQPVLDLALILNITPDHLDRYLKMEEYAKAKFKIINNLKEFGCAYIYEKVWREYHDLNPDFIPRLYGYHPDCYIWTDLIAIYQEKQKVVDLPFSLRNKKSHELENFLAAFAISSHIGIKPQDFLDGWQSFVKPSHRIEYVVEIDGIKYYDDSKGTNVDAVIRAVESLNESILLIAGGVEKGTSFDVWLDGFKNKVKVIFAIGQASHQLKLELSHQIPVIICENLEEAVMKAKNYAQNGDCVLLSPGCASFDMFKDYVHRGQEFQRIVKELIINPHYECVSRS